MTDASPAAEAIVPLISSSVAGPLGAKHLPRLWFKVLLHATGRLADGYRHGQGGFDSMTFENLGIDPNLFIAYVERERPTYQGCEAWVRAHASRIDAGSIAAHNHQIETREKPGDLATPIRERLHLPATMTNSVAINDLEDWDLAHAAVVAVASS